MSVFVRGDVARRLHTLGFPSARTVYLAQNAHRDGGRGGGGQFLSSLVHARVWSLACHVLCCALRGVTRLSDHCCACLAAGVHSGVCFCAEGRCAETPHTGLSQRAFPKGESPPIVSPHYGPPLPHPLCTTRLDPEPPLSSSSSETHLCLNERWCQFRSSDTAKWYFRSTTSIIAVRCP